MNKHYRKGMITTETRVVQAAEDAFRVLGHETRLTILLALWKAYEPWEETAVSFAELRKRVGMPDGSQFNYHLQQLVGDYVRKTDEGYELRRAGHMIVQSVIAGAGIERTAHLEPTEIDPECYLCGGQTVVTYDDEWLFWACTECDGLFTQDDYPEGSLATAEFDPAGLTDRSPEEVLNAAWTGVGYQSELGGVCEACSGPMESWLRVCEDHITDGLCPNCEWREAVVARFRCTICKRNFEVVPWWLVIGHPAVVAFYYDHGVPLQYEDGETFQPRIESSLPMDLDQEIVSEEPLRVRVTIQREGDKLHLTMDETITVIEVEESG